MQRVKFSHKKAVLQIILKRKKRGGKEGKEGKEVAAHG